jgi:hypothetical protein
MSTSLMSGFSPIEALPNELLVSIFRYYRNSSPSSTFLHCLLVCQKWKEIILPILYHDICLTNSNIHSYKSRLSKLNAQHIRSITVCIRPMFGFEGLPLPIAGGGACLETIQLWGRLQFQLPTILKLTNNLHTISLTVSNPRLHSGEIRNSFWIPRPILAVIVDSLPESCVNVEIITKDWDSPDSRPAHFCCSIGKIFRRLKHVHLQLSTICPSILGQATGLLNNAVLPSDRLTEAPFLKSIVLNCLTTFGSNNVKQCGTQVDSREGLTRALHSMFSQGDLPTAKRISIIDSQPPEHWCGYRPLYRRDILRNETLSIPCAYLGYSYFLARFLEGPDIISDIHTIISLAEGRPFIETVSGYRLPDDALDVATERSNSYIAKPMPSLSKEECKLKGLMENKRRVAATLWEHEETSGLRLLNAEYSEGTTTVTPIRQKSLAS